MPERLGSKRRVLFVGEAVTLAHVARPLALASVLDEDGFDIIFAADPRYRRFYPATRKWLFRDLWSIPSEQFLTSLARGAPVYDAATLERYVADDLALIDETGPDVIVGDFRLSLSVSARVRRCPYITISNAYWSPYSRLALPLPVLPFTRILGLEISRALFNLAQPIAVRHHARPLNQLRKRHSMPALEGDLRRAYTDADLTLYADAPELMPTAPLPSSHRFLGPVVWSASAPLPPWWHSLPPHRPIVYVTLGSSGHEADLNATLEALSSFDCTVIASLAGARERLNAPQNVFVADYLPGGDAVQRSHLVICNGGSLTTYQALAAGVPVLGIARNMDQFLNMEGVTRFGAGRTLRADFVRPELIRREAERLLSQAHYRDAARRAAILLSNYDAPRCFLAILDDKMQKKGPACAGPLSD